MDDDGYTLVETQNFTGTTGADVTPEVRSYKGFRSPEAETVTVMADGTTEMNYYYDRLIFDVTFDENGGTEVPDHKDVKYGTEIEVPETQKSGYKFDGWKIVTGTQNVIEGKLIVEENATYEAGWVPNEDTSYVVNHLVQNLENDKYTLVETQDFIGVTDSSVTPEVRAYKGFRSPEAQTVIVKADGTTEVNYYYDRLIFDVTFDENGGKEVPDYKDVKYGTELEVPETQRPGYEFDGWKLVRGTQKVINGKLVVEENAIYEASWILIEKTSVIPKTGDNNDIMLYLMLAILAISGTAIISNKKRVR